MMKLSMVLCLLASLPWTLSCYSFSVNSKRRGILAAVGGNDNDVESVGDLRWFCKTETFCKPFLEVKPFLEQHRAWVAEERLAGRAVTSGYRLDSEGRPGGGGLMLFKAEDYKAAEDFVARDPLVSSGCVNFQLNQWVAEVGDLRLL